MTKRAPIEPPELNLKYLQCSLKGHNNLELKFVSKKEFPNISHVYCALCLTETLQDKELNKLEIVCLDEVLRETVTLSNQYICDLEPIMASFQLKQKQMTKNDFKCMFQSVMSRREKFKKLIQNFKAQIISICQRYEEFFEKQLQALFYQSFSAIDASLLSFKDTFEVLRLRLSSYDQELPKILVSAQNREQYCQNISKVLKDLQSLKSSNLLKSIEGSLQDTFSNSHVAQDFCADRSVETELAETMSRALNVLTEKMENFRISFEAKEKRAQEQDMKKTEGAAITQKGDKIAFKNGDTKENPTKGEKINPENNKKECIENKGKNKQEEEKKADNQKVQIVWPDPADESIEVFEKEMARFYQGDLIKRILEGLANHSTTSVQEGIKKNQGNAKEEDRSKSLIKEKENKRQEQRGEQAQKNERIREDLKEDQKVKSQKGNTKSSKVTRKESNDKEKSSIGIEESTQMDEYYINDEEDEDDDEDEEQSEGDIHKEFFSRMKGDVQADIFKKVFKNRKHHRKYERLFRHKLVKFSAILEENMKMNPSESSDQGPHSISIVRIVNKDNARDKAFMSTQNNLSVKPDSKEAKTVKKSKENINIPLSSQKDLVADFLSQLKIQLTNQEAFARLQKLGKKVTLSRLAKRLSPETIMTVQDFIGEVLRESHIKNILEYRRKRRQYTDNQELVKFKYACRDFFIKYYHHYKNIKCMFLEALGIQKESFNNDYKYWVDQGHTYLVWSRFKAKLQKAPLSESKRKINIEDLKKLLNHLVYFLQGSLEDCKEDFARSKKSDRYLLVEILLTRVYDKAFFTFQIEEEDILNSLEDNVSPNAKEACKIYEDFEKMVAGLMYPEMNVQVKCEITTL